MAPLPGRGSVRRGRAPLWAGLLALCLAAAPVSGQLTEEQQVKLLELHNEYRGMVQPTAANMKPMRWNKTLRVQAESYAVKCIWGHNPDLEELGTGENLFTSTGDLDVAKAVDSWFQEHLDYTYHNNSCPEDKMCGHYTQIVWADTTSVGCAVHRCDTLAGLEGFEKAVNLVCNYSPSGNVIINDEEQLPYEEGEPCSNCPENYQRCHKNLCMPDLEPSEEPEEEDDQTDTPPPGSAAPSIPPDTSLSSTTEPAGPPHIQEPTPPPGTPPAGTESEMEPGEPAEKDEESVIIMMSVGVASTPTLLLTGLLVLLSLGV